jgi:murein L,D-transpeptidase YcbB/YkuD
MGLLLVLQALPAWADPMERVWRELQRHGRRYHDAALLQTLYVAGDRLRWVAGDTPALEADGEVLLAWLLRADAHGIDPVALRLGEIDEAWQAWQTLDAPDPERAAHFDLLLSDALIRYGDELRWGHPAPFWSERDAAVADRAGDRLQAWQALWATRGEGLGPALRALEPTVPSYQRLMEALRIYRGAQRSGGWPTLTAEITPDSPPELILALRERLSLERFLEPSDDPTWDDDLRRGLRRYQEAHHISPPRDLVGPATLAELNVPIAQRVAAIIVSMEQMRRSRRGVDPEGPAVWANIAGFAVEVWEGDDLRFRTRAVVGNLSGGGRNRTPLFSEWMQRIELNPTWYIPERLARNLQPDASRGIVRQGGRLIQRPGPDNALGRVKFLFPNQHAVYLHDTSRPELFDRTIRAYSSGCVRIDRPLELATLLISRDQGRDPAEVQTWIDGIMRTTRTEVVRLEQPMPVHLEYFTVWVAPDGIVEFYGDIYRRDRAAVRRVLQRRDVNLDHL